MRKILVAVLSILLAITIIAGAVKLMTPQNPIEPAEEDIMSIRSLPEYVLAEKSPGTAKGTLDENNTPAPTPAQITSEATPSTAPTASPSPTQEPTSTPKATVSPTQTPEATTPSPTPTASVSVKDKPLSGLIIGVDPGHQEKSNKELEPVAPGSSEMKKKVSSGTAGTYSRVAEHTVNLNVGLHLKKLLEDAGATVIMTRETADVDISNSERAMLFNKHKVDLGIRLHCNGSTDASVKGAFMLVPKDKAYPYYDECVRAAKIILAAYGKRTGIGIKKGITYRDDQTGFNWCERPIVNIEMGHMTNKEEDELITDKSFQKTMAEGIFNGIVEYFS